MRKILIISYFFPPSNITGAYRVYSWAKYLKQSGIYPIIISRRWDNELGSEMIHEKNEHYELYSLPYNKNLRDRISEKKFPKIIKLFGKFLTLFEVVFQNFTTKAIPYKNLYYHSVNLLEANPDIKLIVTSAKPFILFKFGHDLQKKFKIPWIADYRDDWSTSQWYSLEGNQDLYTTNKILKAIDYNREMKWLTRATCFTTISDFYTKRIGDFIKKPGHTVMNGFDEDEFNEFEKEHLFEEFTITYNGSLYFSQDIKPFLEGFIDTIKHFKNKIKIRIYFPGLADPHQKERIESILKGYEDNYIITKRMSKDKVIKIQQKSHLLLMDSHQGLKGVTSSKIFEYVGIQKPIVLCPGDKDILEKIVKETKSGFVWDSKNEAKKGLITIIDNFIINKKTPDIKNNKEREFYSRKSQAKKLGLIINNILNNQ